MGGDSTIGVDIGGTKMLGVAVGPDGSVLADARLATPRAGEALLDAVAGLVGALAARVPGSTVSGVGVGAPGLVDTHGVLHVAPNLPEVAGLAIGAGLAARLSGLPLRLGNDATFAGWAEYSVGAARGSAHTLLVTLGTGIGGGIVIGHRLIEGAHGYAGEFGHMVVDADGPECPCGRRGCWERLASGSALARLGRRAAAAGAAGRVLALAGGDPESVLGEHVTIAAAEGDPDAVAILSEYGRWVALGLANLVNLFDPDCVVVGGGLVGAWAVLEAPVTSAFSAQALGVDQRTKVRLVPAALGERAGAIGGALLARALA
jgi:glucokinase